MATWVSSGTCCTEGLVYSALDNPLGFREACIDVAFADLGEVGDVEYRLRTEGGLDVVVAAEVGMYQPIVAFVIVALWLMYNGVIPLPAMN